MTCDTRVACTGERARGNTGRTSCIFSNRHSLHLFAQLAHAHIDKKLKARQTHAAAACLLPVDGAHNPLQVPYTVLVVIGEAFEGEPTNALRMQTRAQCGC